MATVTRATVTKGKNSNRPVGNSKSSSNSGKNNDEESKIGNQEAGTRAKGSSPQVSTTKTQNAEENKKLLLNKIEILKHWFLLDYDLVAALNKGNHSLIPMAEARVNYLIGLVPDKLLAEGISGEEEALWSIHELLYNNGCWEKASNLVVEGYDGSENGNYTDPVQGFLNSYAHLIHPNTKEARKFISSLSYLVEPTVFKDAMKGSDKALSLALGQIHHKTLPNLPPKPPLKTYKEALQSPVKKLPEKEMPPPKFAPTKMAAANTSATSEFKVTESPEKELPLVARHRDEQIAPTEPQQQEGDILQETVLHTSNWMPREIDSSSSFPISSTEVYMSEVENEIEQTVSEDGTHCSEVLAELKNLKVQVKRGRPRKYQKPQLNKHFKLSRKKKTRGEGLKQTSHFFLNAGFDEAEAIYETGTMMGLLTSHSKERSIEIIKANLQ
ncbi:hypothetical protein ACET3Z_027985 [Daucus carota]